MFWCNFEEESFLWVNDLLYYCAIVSRGQSQIFNLYLMSKRLKSIFTYLLVHSYSNIVWSYFLISMSS